MDRPTGMLREIPSHARQGQGCGMRREVGCGPRAFPSALTSGLPNPRGPCKALPNCPPPPPPLLQARAEGRPPLPERPAFAKQPGALGLSLSALFGCHGSCFRKPFLPTIKAVLPGPASSTLPFRPRAVGAGGAEVPDAHADHTPATTLSLLA